MYINTLTFEHKDVHSIRNTMYYEKIQYYLKFLHSLAHHKLNQNDNCSKYKDNKFIHISNNESTIRLITVKHFEFIKFKFIYLSCIEFFGWRCI